MGKLSISNENHNIRNILWNVPGLKTGFFFNKINKLSSLDLDGGYAGNIYTLWVSLSGKF